MSKSLGEANNERLNWGADYADFPIGKRVKVVCLAQDFHSFNGDIGTVVKNTGEYLGIIVEFDVKRQYPEWTMTEFNFKPTDLVPIHGGYKWPKKKRLVFAKKESSKPLFGRKT